MTGAIVGLGARAEAPAAAGHVVLDCHSRAEAGRPALAPLPKLVHPVLHHAARALHSRVRINRSQHLAPWMPRAADAPLRGHPVRSGLMTGAACGALCSHCSGAGARSCARVAKERTMSAHLRSGKQILPSTPQLDCGILCFLLDAGSCSSA